MCLEMTLNRHKQIDHEIHCLQSEIEKLLKHRFYVDAMSPTETDKLNKLCKILNCKLVDPSAEYPCIVDDSLEFVEISRQLKVGVHSFKEIQENLADIASFLMNNLVGCKSIRKSESNNGLFHFELSTDTGYIEVSALYSNSQHGRDLRIILNKVDTLAVDRPAIPANEMLHSPKTNIVKWIAIGGKPSKHYTDRLILSWFTAISGVKMDESYSINVSFHVSSDSKLNAMFLELPNKSTWKATNLTDVSKTDIELMCFSRLNQQLLVLDAFESDYRCFTKISVRASAIVSQSFPGLSNEPCSLVTQFQFEKV